MNNDLIVTRTDGILVITMNRPEVRNAMNRSLSVAMSAALDQLDEEPDLQVGVITGAGGTFCSGMDLKAFVQGERPDIEGRGFAGITERPPRKPVIAAVEGYALAGGFEMALACDLVVAANTAMFGLPEATRGLLAGQGGLIRLPRKIPAQIAMEYALTGEHFSAVEAHRWGLVNRLTDPGDTLPAARELASRIARNAPLSILGTKKIINGQATWPREEVWQRSVPILEEVLATSDAQEGARAFAEKRPPVWRGE
ncbi:MAG: crotonase/enoyl-CoA hydratase family protein [Candidatus Dormibacteria bacterium]